MHSIQTYLVTQTSTIETGMRHIRQLKCINTPFKNQVTPDQICVESRCHDNKTWAPTFTVPSADHKTKRCRRRTQIYTEKLDVDDDTSYKMLDGIVTHYQLTIFYVLKWKRNGAYEQFELQFQCYYPKLVSSRPVNKDRKTVVILWLVKSLLMTTALIIYLK